MALKYVNAEQGLELLEQGYELHGRGMRYCSYRFTKKPGDDTVDYWYRRRDSWDNGSWTVDEFLRNMGSEFGDTLMLCVWKDPDGNIVRESKSPAGRTRLDEARTPTDPMPSDSMLAKLWIQKRDMLSNQDSRFRFITYWKWNNLPLVERNRRLLWLVTFNFGAYVGNELRRDPGIFLGLMTKTIWGDHWIEGLNQEFGTMLTKDDYREAVLYYTRPLKYDNREMKRLELANIKQLTPTKRQMTGEYVKNASYSTCFRELYETITNPVNAGVYKGKYKQKALSGLRGRPSAGQTYIEFNMEKLPITMVRSKDGNRTYSEDEPLVYCISGAAKLKPQATYDDKVDYYTQIKKFVHRYSDVPYLKMTPCSLDYWMKNISRRFVSDRKRQEDSAMRFDLFQKTSVLQLREDGQFRFWQNGMTDEEGWLEDPCLDYEMVQCVDDEMEEPTEE